MKIAIPVEKDQVAEHFGRCPKFQIITIKDKKILNKKVVDNPGHKTGSLPEYFKNLGVNLVIAGGAGWKAQEYFKEYNIDYILGVQGNIDQVLKSYFDGTLKYDSNLCSPGLGKGYGVKKEGGDKHA